jgi:hypothetical protein
MDCTDIKALLSGLVDDEVDQESRHAAERHLAECAACRAMLSEFETLNAAIALDAEQIAPEGVSADFIGAVLSRTVYATEPRRTTPSAWINWTGWLAAAAALLLAASIWVMDHRGVDRQAPTFEQPVARTDVGPHAVRNASYLVSSVYDGDLPDAPSNAEAPSAEEAPAPAPAPTIDTLADAASDGAGPDANRPRTALLRTDAENVWTTALLMEMLLVADLESFADLERIREIADYEELLVNLAAARARSDAADRPAVHAAESVLLRILNGPVSQRDLYELRETVEMSDLTAQLYELSNRWDGQTAL